MQFHHVRNLSNKDYIFHSFLSAQQQKMNFFCYVIKRSPSNFLNKTQLKIKIKINFFNWVGPS
jgi:hypothetical protein